MAAVVERVGGEARRGEPGGDVAIAPGVLTDAMSDDHHGTRLSRGQPRLPVDLGTVCAGEETVRVLVVCLRPPGDTSARGRRCLVGSQACIEYQSVAHGAPSSPGWGPGVS